MTENYPHDELLNPQAALMLEHIAAKLPNEGSEKAITSKSGRLNKEGRLLTDEVYTEFLHRMNGSYREVLEICKDAESFLHPDDIESQDLDMLKVLRSIRGKIVYHAHKTWAEKEMLIDKYGDESASNIMRYSKTLRQDKKIDVYEEARRIEKEKQTLEENLRIENELMEQQNIQLVEQDIETISKELTPNERKSILTGLKSKLKHFSQRIMEPHTRGKIVAGALATVAVASMVIGYITHLNETGQQSVKDTASVDTTSEGYAGAKVGLLKPLPPAIPRPSEETQILITPTGNNNGYDEDYFTKGYDIPPIEEDLEMGIVEYTESPNKLSLNENAYLAGTHQKAINVARSLDFIQGNYEDPSNMCGPLAIKLLEDSHRLPKDFKFDMHSFWLGTPEKLKNTLTPEYFDISETSESIKNYDFENNPLKAGDILYLKGGSFTHWITITEIDEDGRAWTISNVRYGDKDYHIDKVLLYDPNDKNIGYFRNEWSNPSSTTGWTGSNGFLRYRLKNSTIMANREEPSTEYPLDRIYEDTLY